MDAQKQIDGLDIDALLEAIRVVQSREIDATEAAKLAEGAAGLLDKLLPHCRGARHAWVWKAALHGARGCLLEAAEHFDRIDIDVD